jgi:outer membrane immunogenic protein
MNNRLFSTLCGCAFIVAGSGFAFSADMARKMPVKAPPPPPAPVLTWSGCYLGIEGGGAWAHESVIATDGSGDTVTDIHPKGGLFGGTVGCNYQANYLVIGIENDISWTGLHGTGFDQPPFATDFSHSVSTHWLDTLRGRVGAAFGPALFYATGGAAFTRINDSATGGGQFVSANTDVTGWTVGGGIEYIFAPRWSVKAEYLYVKFPTIHDAFDTASGGFFVGVDTRLTENIVRAGINYRFWGY